MISVSLSRLWSSSGSISLQSVFRAMSFQSGFASYMRSIRWWESSMVSAGASWVRRATSTRLGLGISVIDVIILVISGIWYFRKTEQTFADVI